MDAVGSNGMDRDAAAKLRAVGLGVSISAHELRGANLRSQTLKLLAKDLCVCLSPQLQHQDGNSVGTVS